MSNFKDGSEVLVQARVRRTSEDGNIVVDLKNGESACLADRGSVSQAKPDVLGIDDLRKCCVVNARGVTSHLKHLGFDVDDDIDLDTKALWINRIRGVHALGAGHRSLEAKFILPSDVFGVQKPDMRRFGLTVGLNKDLLRLVRKKLEELGYKSDEPWNKNQGGGSIRVEDWGVYSIFNHCDASEMGSIEEMSLADFFQLKSAFVTK